jgi:arginase family enzyme
VIRRTLIQAPIDCSGAGRGEEHAPAALLAAGLLDRIDADDVIESDARIRDSSRDPATGVIGADQIRHAAMAIASDVRTTIGRGGTPLVIGGDCTLLLGVFLGVPRGTGLWFVDGHADFFDGETSPTGEAADMDLAILTGHGPPGLFDGERLVTPSSVALLGHRPDTLGPDTAEENARIDPGIVALTALEIRDRGPRLVGEEIVGRSVAPSWLHVDLDVLDERVMPAVSYPQPLGLDWQELGDLLHPLAAAPDLVGVSVADLNPDLDRDGEHARRTVDVLARILGERS